jgi:hypothetical protein
MTRPTTYGELAPYSGTRPKLDRLEIRSNGGGGEEGSPRRPNARNEETRAAETDPDTAQILAPHSTDGEQIRGNALGGGGEDLRQTPAEFCGRLDD